MIAWVLNLDAEDELSHVGAHTPTRGMRERIASLAATRLGGLLAPDDVVVWPGEAKAPGLEGRAWCPTRWAQERLREAGARVPAAPSMEVLRRVNHRRFSFELGTFLPGSTFVTTEAELEAVLRHEQWWLFKRPLGFAGRGRKRILPSRLTTEERAWLRSSLPEGLQVEPWVERELDCGLHGFVEQDGTWRLGQLTLQQLEPTGAWRSTSLAPPGTLAAAEAQALRAEATRTAQALVAAGYFGPFGIDGYRWRASDGARHFQPRSEINARYSMGWAIGMGQRTS